MEPWNGEDLAGCGCVIVLSFLAFVVVIVTAGLIWKGMGLL